MFTKTTKAIAELLGKQFGWNMILPVLQLEKETFQIPMLPQDATWVQKLQ